MAKIPFPCEVNKITNTVDITAIPKAGTVICGCPHFLYIEGIWETDSLFCRTFFTK